jgi:hypothetical protein
MIPSSERRVGAILRAHGFREEAGAVDFSNDAGVIVETKSRIGGVRDLRAAILQLASRANEGVAQEAWLIVADHKMPESISGVWKDALALLRPTLAKKLKLVAVSGQTVTVVPDDPQLLEIGRAVATLERAERPAKAHDAYFDVLHVLLVRWLRSEGPIQMSDLGAMTGRSQPTLRTALRRFGPELRRDSRRRVELTTFPQRSWREMVALSRRIRQSDYFEDASGRPRTPAALLERLQRSAPPGVAVSGVFAARHWDPEFDLEGEPRLDLCVHAPHGRPSLSFVKALDPALRLAETSTSASVAIHRVQLRDPIYERSAKQKLPWADPVETLLDLEDLRLHTQADELVRRLRSSAG